MIMLTVLLLWRFKWLFMIEFVLLADCGMYTTKTLFEASYLHNVTGQNEFVFALKSDPISVVHLFDDTSLIGKITLGVNVNSSSVAIATNCVNTVQTHTSSLITPTKYSWMWIRWDWLLEFGTGKIPGSNNDVAAEYLNNKVVKYIGFGKYYGNPKSDWIAGQTSENINESMFKMIEGRLNRLPSEAYQVRTSTQCVMLCLSLNGCDCFNLSLKVNGFSDCELIKKEVIITEVNSCAVPATMDWVEEDAAWTHYYL